MKKTTYSVLAVGLMVGFMGPASGEEWRDKCTAWSGLAESVMKNRQVGVAMADMMNITGLDDASEMIIIAAYEQPRFGGDRFRSEAIQDFRNDWYLKCVNTLRPE